MTIDGDDLIAWGAVGAVLSAKERRKVLTRIATAEAAE